MAHTLPLGLGCCWGALLGCYATTWAGMLRRYGRGGDDSIPRTWKHAFSFDFIFTCWNICASFAWRWNARPNLRQKSQQPSCLKIKMRLSFLPLFKFVAIPIGVPNTEYKALEKLAFCAFPMFFHVFFIRTFSAFPADAIHHDADIVQDRYCGRYLVFTSVFCS